MKIIIMCDSFKGTLSSKEVNQIIKESIRPYFVHHEILTFAIADGGEGTLDAFVSATHAELVSIPVSNPYLEPIGATYARVGDAAMIELASAAGVNLIPKRLNPLETTTFGVGQLINHALENGVKHIMLGLGGSATNDAGCGIASALGVKFYDANGNSFLPTGKSLKDIASVDDSEIHEKALKATWTIVSDVNNPMFGPEGAAFVYAKQKGADDVMIQELDEGLKHFAEIIKNHNQKDINKTEGAGAAGGVGGGMSAFFNTNYVSGINFFMNLVGLEDYLADTDMIITGEGRLDAQTLNGKVVYGISYLAKEYNIYAVAVVGQMIDGPQIAKLPLDEIVVIHKEAQPMQRIIQHAESDLRIIMQSWAFHKSMEENSTF